MFHWADVLGLARRPAATLERMEGRRRGVHGLLGIGISILAPALVAELAALRPFTPPSGLGAPHGEARLLTDTFFHWLDTQRFLLPLLDLAGAAALWLGAILLIHLVAQRLGGHGSLPGYLGLCGSIAMTGLLVFPVGLLEALLRVSQHAAAAEVVSGVTGSLAVTVLAWQNVLLVIAARRHYRLSTGRAVTAVLGPAAGVVALLVALVILATVAAVLALRSPS